MSVDGDDNISVGEFLLNVDIVVALVDVCEEAEEDGGGDGEPKVLRKEALIKEWCEKNLQTDMKELDRMFRAVKRSFRHFTSTTTKKMGVTEAKDALQLLGFHVAQEEELNNAFDMIGPTKQVSGLDAADFLIIVLGGTNGATIPEKNLKAVDVLVDIMFGFGPKKTHLKQDFEDDDLTDAGLVIPRDKFMLDPTSRIRTIWEMLILAACVVSVFLLPVYISLFPPENYTSFFAVFCVLDSIFLFDILVILRTGYIDADGHRCIRAIPSTMRYVKSISFWLDLIGAGPWDAFVFASSDIRSREPLAEYVSIIRIYRVFRFWRLLRAKQAIRMRRALSILSVVEDLMRVYRNLTRLAEISFIVFSYFHWSACMQIAVVRWSPPDSNSWIGQIEELHDADGFYIYSTAFFQSVGYVGTGYGASTPLLFREVWITIFCTIAGGACYALVISSLSTIVRTMDAGAALYSRKLEMFEGYMELRQLPRELRNKIRSYFSHRWKNNQFFDEENLLEELPPSIRVDVCAHLAWKLVKQVPFFQSGDVGFVYSVISFLVPQTYMQGDTICFEGEVCTSMFFVASGAVAVYKEGQQVTILGAGSYFGEVSLIRKCKRATTVKAIQECDVYQLYEEHFDRLIQEFPRMRTLLGGMGDAKDPSSPSISFTSGGTFIPPPMSRAASMFGTAEQGSEDFTVSFTRSAGTQFAQQSQDALHGPRRSIEDENGTAATTGTSMDQSSVSSSRYRFRVMTGPELVRRLELQQAAIEDGTSVTPNSRLGSTTPRASSMMRGGLVPPGFSSGAASAAGGGSTSISPRRSGEIGAGVGGLEDEGEPTSFRRKLSDMDVNVTRGASLVKKTDISDSILSSRSPSMRPVNSRRRASVGAQPLGWDKGF